jgi:phosphatidylglycerophosphatase A
MVRRVRRAQGSAVNATGTSTGPRRADLRFMLGHPARLIALGFGSGLSPKAPGTVGTLCAWASFILLARGFGELQWAITLALGLLVGVWA